MAPTTEDVLRLRRMTDEPTSETYNDASLIAYLESWSLPDKNGKTFEDLTWLPAYDLHAAAAEIWEEKAAKAHSKYDFSTDGSTFNANQIYENCMNQARYHAARSKMRVKTTPNLISGTSVSDLYLGVYANIDPPEEDDFLEDEI